MLANVELAQLKDVSEALTYHIHAHCVGGLREGWPSRDHWSPLVLESYRSVLGSGSFRDSCGKTLQKFVPHSDALPCSALQTLNVGWQIGVVSLLGHLCEAKQPHDRDPMECHPYTAT